MTQRCSRLVPAPLTERHVSRSRAAPVSLLAGREGKGREGKGRGVVAYHHDVTPVTRERRDGMMTSGLAIP